MATATYPIARYLSIDAASSPSLTADGGLLFLQDTTGTPQLWYRPDRETDPRRLTAEDERISFVAASPTRSEAIFGMDQGSDEHDQLFRYDLSTGVQTPLTRQPEAIHTWGAWSPDGDRFAFAANRHERDRFDIYVQPREGGPADAELVHRGPGGFLSVADWGPDGRLALSRARSSNTQTLSTLSVETGEHTQIAEPEARHRQPSFGPEGGLYCLTDRAGDRLALGRFGLDGEFTVVVADDEWNVDGYAVAEGALAYTRNVDGYSSLHRGTLADPTEFLEVHSTAPEGVIAELTIGPAGERLAVARSESATPYEIGVGALDEDPPVSWTPQGTLGIPEARFRTPETIRYQSFDGRSIPAYWTLPADPEAGATPAIVDIHGGPHHQRRPWFYPVKQYFLDRGYAVFEPNVRGSSGYGRAYTQLDDRDRRLDSVADIKAAVEWLHDRPAVDPDRVVAYGRSYGGFMVLAAITQYPDLWAGAVDFVGIADFETFLENTGAWRRGHREAEYGSLDDPELLAEISPVHDIDQVACPLFVQHGANDPRVPVGEAEQIADRAREQGVPVETLIFEDEGHHTTDRSNLIEQFEQIAAFLGEHV